MELEGDRRYALESFPENYQLYAHHTGDQRRDLYLVGEPYLAVRRPMVSVVVSCYLSSPTQAQICSPVPLCQRVCSPRAVVDAGREHGSCQMQVQILWKATTELHIAEPGAREEAMASQ